VKLNANIVQCLRRLRHQSKPVKITDLANEYGVSYPSMVKALSGVTWRHVIIYKDSDGRYGSSRSTTKLTAREVYLLRVLRSWSAKPNDIDLAIEYGVVNTTIYNALRGTSYGSVPMYDRPAMRAIGKT